MQARPGAVGKPRRSAGAAKAAKQSGKDPFETLPTECPAARNFCPTDTLTYFHARTHRPAEPQTQRLADNRRSVGRQAARSSKSSARTACTDGVHSLRMIAGHLTYSYDARACHENFQSRLLCELEEHLNVAAAASATPLRRCCLEKRQTARSLLTRVRSESTGDEVQSRMPKWMRCKHRLSCKLNCDVDVVAHRGSGSSCGRCSVPS